jgi:hypothetical protein
MFCNKLEAKPKPAALPHHRACVAARTKPTVPGASRRSATPLGAVQVVGEALQVTLDIVKSRPNRLSVASCHHLSSPFKGQRNNLPASLQCHGMKPHCNPTFGAARHLPPVSTHGAPSQAGAAPLPIASRRRPSQNWRPGLDQKITLCDIKSWPMIASLMAGNVSLCYRPVDQSPWTRSMRL